MPGYADGRQPDADRERRTSIVPAPLRRAHFRQLWLGMASSYAGERFQQLAQTWLVATLTSSALAAGAIGTLGSLPLLFLPLGGVIADLVDRRRLLIASHLVGAAATAVVAVLVMVDRVGIWHIYAWAVANGMVSLLSRLADRVALTEVVPAVLGLLSVVVVVRQREGVSSPSPWSV